MQLEVGKYYKTRDGRKVGPAELISKSDHSWNVWWPEGPFHYSREGQSCLNCRGDDLIAEWTDETTAIDHLRKAAELFLAAGNDKAAFDVLGVVLDHE